MTSRQACIPTLLKKSKDTPLSSLGLHFSQRHLTLPQFQLSLGFAVTVPLHTGDHSGMVGYSLPSGPVLYSNACGYSCGFLGLLNLVVGMGMGLLFPSMTFAIQEPNAE